MEKLTPFFEVNGKRYEIKRTRYLLLQYAKLQEETKLSNEDKTNGIKAQSLIGDIQRYIKKYKELEEKYFETFDEEDEKKYLKMKELYQSAMAELTALEVETGSTTRLQNASYKILEQIVILGLVEQYQIDNKEAENIWCSYVDEIGKQNAIEWLSAMAECLFANEQEENDNSFLAQMRAREIEKARKKK